MRIVLDTNVFVSGIFFTGPPFEILNAWRAGKIEVVVSPSILNEYHRVGEELSMRKLDQLDSVESLEELRIPPGNQLEQLSGDRKGQYSIRINRQYRLCFKWTELGPSDVEAVDYHS